MITYQYFLISALIFCFFNNSENKLQNFCQFLIGVFLFEGMGKFFKIYLGHNTFIYNVYFVYAISYYIFIFNIEICKFHKSKKRTNDLVLFWILCVLSFLYYRDFDKINSIAYNLGMLIVIFLIFKYFYILLMGETYKALVNIPHFWLASGILLFYSSAFPSLCFTNILILHDIELARAAQKWVQYGNLFIAISYNLVSLCSCW